MATPDFIMQEKTRKTLEKFSYQIIIHPPYFLDFFHFNYVLFKSIHNHEGYLLLLCLHQAPKSTYRRI